VILRPIFAFFAIRVAPVSREFLRFYISDWVDTHKHGMTLGCSNSPFKPRQKHLLCGQSILSSPHVGIINHAAAGRHF
jgi:hypothetical protein